MSDFKLLFDGNCIMCQKLSKVVLFLSKTDLLEVKPFQSHLEVSQDIPYEQLNAEIHFLSKESAFKGHIALIELSRHLKIVCLFYPLLKLYPFRKCIQGVYFLAKRYRKSSNACKVK